MALPTGRSSDTRAFFEHDSTTLKEIKYESMFLFSSYHRTNGHEIELEVPPRRILGSFFE